MEGPSLVQWDANRWEAGTVTQVKLERCLILALLRRCWSLDTFIFPIHFINPTTYSLLGTILPCYRISYSLLLYWCCSRHANFMIQKLYCLPWNNVTDFFEWLYHGFWSLLERCITIMHSLLQNCTCYTLTKIDLYRVYTVLLNTKTQSALLLFSVHKSWTLVW